MTPFNEYQPDHITPPGWTLWDKLEELGMSQAELARLIGRPEKTINEIIQGEAGITPQIALLFELALAIPRDFWLKRELRYRQTLNDWRD